MKNAVFTILIVLIILVINTGAYLPVDTKNYEAFADEFSGISDDSLHNCRMWGMITAGGFNDTTKKEHLSSLKQLAAANPNGWGMGFYSQTKRGGNIPIMYRGMWRADQDFMFDSCSSMMLDNLSTSGIVHIRRSSSGYVNIPDPHPFFTKSLTRDFSMMFAHNGTLDKPTLITLLESYPETNHFHYSGDGANDPNHDTDLYRLYLMKWIDEHPSKSITTCLYDAIFSLTNQMGTNPSYNFIMVSNYDTLWALRYNNALSYRRETGSSGYVWEIASEALSDTGWIKATNYFLYVFSPNRATPDSIPVKDAGFGLPENAVNNPAFNFSFPNPSFGHTLNIKIESKENHQVSLHLYGSQGQLLSKTPEITVNPGLNNFSYDICNLKPGIYYLKLEAGKDSQTKELIILDR
jgi:predicted glutamine amidotransferase